MDFSSLPDDYFTTSMQFTKKIHTDVYPSIDPSSPALSQAGKVVIITGASKGLGRHVSYDFLEFFRPLFNRAIVWGFPIEHSHLSGCVLSPLPSLISKDIIRTFSFSFLRHL
jgi:hypothetical protein